MENTMTYSMYSSPVLRRNALRRRKERQKKIFKLVSAFILVILIGVLFLSVRSFAGSEKDGIKRNKYYKSITIEKGDTISGIADRYISSEYSSKRKYISEIVNINHLADADQICAGSNLIIPYYR